MENTVQYLLGIDETVAFIKYVLNDCRVNT